MKLTEISQPSDQTLTEQIGANNNTGYLTEDLVNVVRAELNNEWSEPLTGDELMKLIESWVK